ncbi:hypothetical protein [Levilactobacillus suantsaii]|uniref:hypothetical protein n=1 Tax=Levilactobacillus suantsaii TaxID=2292255 RepID=UPI00100BF16D|nr:hypothetical protein [Levilactobacillus suantsaii]
MAQATDEAATAEMPAGAQTLDNVFNMPSSLGPLPNSAKIIKSTNDASAGQQAFQITDTKNQVGAIWSKDDHKMDLSHDQTMSMWMYFGGSPDTVDGSTGEGMAFVLQNSGPDAITQGISQKMLPGQTLGVWGLDNDTSASTSDIIAKKAIQNSWAIEFDEYNNSDTTGGNNKALDNGNNVNGGHILASYPGDSGSYKRLGINATSAKYCFRLIHGNMINTKTGKPTNIINPDSPYNGLATKLSDGSWHHFTLSWKAPAINETTGTMTYTFNDKDPLTGLKKPVDPKYIITKDVDISKLNLAPIDSTGSARKVYWGVTGTTSDVFTNNVVAFDQLPGWLTAAANLTIKDETLNKAVTDNSQEQNATSQVNSGDKLTYTYKLTYTGGTQAWQDVTTALPKPNGVTFSTGTITYAQGGTEELTAAELNGESIGHRLQLPLSADNKSATVTLSGTADHVTSVQNVAAAKHEFTGANQTASVDSPAYTISPGSLTFGTVNSQSTFKETALTGTNQKVWRKDDWEVDVEDTRQVGSQWAVTAQADTLKDGTEPLRGQLHYVDSQQADHLLGKDAVTIMTQTKKAGENQTDVTKDWNDNNHGIYLAVDGDAQVGHYSGTITWTLNNVPN